MLTDDSRILAIEPDIYKAWLEQARAFKVTETVLADLRGADAAAKLRPARRGVGDIVVLRVGGFISQKASLMTLLFGGTSTEALAEDVRAAVAEPSVGSIVLDFNSPGGSVFGLPEAAKVIRSLRGPKPILAVSNPLMASAAYYLAAQADEIIATPSSLTGSIGTMAVHVDESSLIEKLGLKVEEFTYGERKAEESGSKPLSSEARQAIQARVDYYGTMFEADVAKGRGIGPGRVRAHYGQGAVFNAEEALSSGMVDKLGVLEDVLGELASGKRLKGRVVAEADPVEIAARAALAGLTGLDPSVK